jgi:hypothetical protein
MECAHVEHWSDRLPIEVWRRIFWYKFRYELRDHAKELAAALGPRRMLVEYSARGSGGNGWPLQDGHDVTLYFRNGAYKSACGWMSGQTAVHGGKESQVQYRLVQFIGMNVVMRLVQATAHAIEGKLAPPKADFHYRPTGHILQVRPIMLHEYVDTGNHKHDSYIGTPAAHAVSHYWTRRMGWNIPAQTRLLHRP